MAARNTEDATLQGTLSKQRRWIVAGILVAGAIYVAIPQFGVLGSSWSAMADADWRYGVAAFGFLLASFAAASGLYVTLAFRHLNFAITFLVQVASGFASRSLPAGVGSIGVNYLYLRGQAMSKAAAATVVAVNNLLGFAGHGLWILLAVVAFPSGFVALQLRSGTQNWLMTLAAVAVLGLLIVLARNRVRRVLRQVRLQVLRYKKVPARLAGALLLAFSLTGCYIAMLWLSGAAVGASVSIVGAIVALTVGVITQTATPTPGGLGGAEAGLVAGLVLGGVPASQAVAATLLYRVITFWLPLVIGAPVMLFVLRRGYVH